MTTTFERNTFGKRFGSMLKVDFKRLFLSRTFYIFVASCLLAPILILVMTSMMGAPAATEQETGIEGAESVESAEVIESTEADENTEGVGSTETTMESFDNVWQIIGSVSSPATDSESGAMPEMGLTTMCNINMLCFAFAAFVSIFVAEDFRSGYAKNLFTVRAKKTDYVASKTVVLFIATAIMTVAFFVGAILGGIFGGVPFTMEGFGVIELVMCMLAKIAINLALVALFFAVSTIAKGKMWLSLVLSMCSCMLIFNVLPMVAPLDSGIINVVICLVVGILASLGLGAISNLILKKTSLV